MGAVITHNHTQQATDVLRSGGIIVYPTESVFGIGCDPFNRQAVERLLTLKERPQAKGLILITHDWHHVMPLLQPIADSVWAKIHQLNETQVCTWVLPCQKGCLPWATGEHQSLAIRLTKHEIAHKLCRAFNGPIISTSANTTAAPPAKTVAEAKHYFGDCVDYYLDGPLGGLAKPTEIRDALSGKILRRG